MKLSDIKYRLRKVEHNTLDADTRDKAIVIVNGRLLSAKTHAKCFSSKAYYRFEIADLIRKRNRNMSVVFGHLIDDTIILEKDLIGHITSNGEREYTTKELKILIAKKRRAFKKLGVSNVYQCKYTNYEVGYDLRTLTKIWG